MSTNTLVVVIGITLTLVLWIGLIWHDTVTVRRIKKQISKDSKSKA